MEMRPLGGTGIEVSLLGLGTVKFGRTAEVKYPDAFKLPSDGEIRRLLEQARDLGINLLDTAPAYGVAEERLGRLLERRGDWVIVAKAGENFDGAGSSFDFSAAALRASVEASLARLRTDYIDCLLLHSDGSDEAILSSDEVIEMLAALKRDGLARAVGISSKSVAGGLLGVALLDVVMVTLNQDDQSQLPVIEAARDAGKGVLIKKALASGHVGAGGAAQALGQAARTPGVAAIVVGTVNPAHLTANAAALG